MNEFRGQFNDVMAITELRGSYPTVPLAADVDYEGLIAEDTRLGTQPVFLTVPIGKAGVTSGNNRHYDDAFVTELERQTLQSKPVGLMGHLSPSERATSFPPEAVHWVGAIRDGEGTLWGKGYIPPGAIRDRIQRYKAQGKAIATSIDAFAEGVWDETLKAFRMAANSLRLNQIDIAPADRAGIPDLAAVPLLTTEMQPDIGPDAGTETQEETVDKLQVINEMTAEDARLLPDSVRQAIVDSVPTPPAVQHLAEIRAALGLDDNADVVQTVTEMRRTQEAQAKAAIAARITELSADKEKGIKLEAVRGLVVELVTARNPQTVQEAEAAYTQVVESDAVKAALSSHVVETMGPRQGAGSLAGQNNQTGKYFRIPQEA